MVLSLGVNPTPKQEETSVSKYTGVVMDKNERGIYVFCDIPDYKPFRTLVNKKYLTSSEVFNIGDEVTFELSSVSTKEKLIIINVTLKSKEKYKIIIDSLESIHEDTPNTVFLSTEKVKDLTVRLAMLNITIDDPETWAQAFREEYGLALYSKVLNLSRGKYGTIYGYVFAVDDENTTTRIM